MLLFVDATDLHHRPLKAPLSASASPHKEFSIRFINHHGMSRRHHPVASHRAAAPVAAVRAVLLVRRGRQCDIATTLVLFGDSLADRAERSFLIFFSL